jgi:hypothetical protein
VNYIERIASRIRSHIDPEDLPDGDVDELFALYAVLALARGPDVTREDVHNAWAAWMTTREPEHSALVPFEQLDPSTATDDEPFVIAIRQVSYDSGFPRSLQCGDET